jgi:hypothetical protein
MGKRGNKCGSATGAPIDPDPATYTAARYVLFSGARSMILTLRIPLKPQLLTAVRETTAVSLQALVHFTDAGTVYPSEIRSRGIE